MQDEWGRHDPVCFGVAICGAGDKRQVRKQGMVVVDSWVIMSSPGGKKESACGRTYARVEVG